MMRGQKYELYKTGIVTHSGKLHDSVSATAAIGLINSYNTEGAIHGFELRIKAGISQTDNARREFSLEK